MKTLDTAIPAPHFASLPVPRGRWSSFGLSFLVQATLLVGIIKTTISFVAPALRPDKYDNVQLVAPVLATPHEAARPSELPPARVLKVEVRHPEVRQRRIELQRQQKIEVANITPPPLPIPVTKAEVLHSPEMAPAAKLPRPITSTNFGGSSAPVTQNKPARQVQMGGFGDPNGVPVDPDSTGNGIAVTKLGSFDLPAGDGSGNGTRGTEGVRGTVASAGFGNGAATSGESAAGSSQKRVGLANFGSVTPPLDSPKHQVVPQVPKDTPVALLSKPIPNYTSEARQRRIEGDVELDVEFSATGKVHVIRVLQSLGYGLDEAAIKAAENIRFAPARRDGQAVDAHGRLKIVFRLS